MGSLAMTELFSLYPLPAYKVSKAALNALTIQWAQALVAEHFVVASVNPGVGFDPSYYWKAINTQTDCEDCDGGRRHG